MDALEDIRINITVAASDQNTGLKLEFILLSALLLFMMALLSLRFVFLAGVVITGHASNSAIAVLLAAILILILVFFVLFIKFIDLLEEQTLKASSIKDFLMLFRVNASVTKVVTLLLLRLLLIFVSHDLHELHLSVDCDAHLLKHALNLELDVLILEGTWIDNWKVLLHDRVRVVVLLNVPRGLWDRQDDRRGADTAIEETLDEGVGVEGSAIDDTV